MHLGTRMESEQKPRPTHGTWHRDPADGRWALDLFGYDKYITRYGWDTPDEVVADVWNDYPNTEIAINRVVDGVEVSAYWDRPERGIW